MGVLIEGVPRDEQLPQEVGRAKVQETAESGLIDRRCRLDAHPNRKVKMSLKEQPAEYRTGWYQRVPAERQAIIGRHIEQLRGTIARTMLKAGSSGAG